MSEITGNLKQDVKDLLGESANLVTGFFKRGLCTVRAVADKWKVFAHDISDAVGTLMKPPFVEGGPEAPAQEIGTDTEPLVVVMESSDPELPVGTEMPLSQANETFRLRGKEYRQNNWTPQPFKVRIDYIKEGCADRYWLPLQLGESGSMLEQMERHIESCRTNPDIISSFFSNVSAETRGQLEAEFVPFIHNSLDELSHGVLTFFRQHCGITEMEKTLHAQAAALPEKDAAAFLAATDKTIHDMRTSLNGSASQPAAQKREQTADRPTQAQSYPAEKTGPNTATRPRRSVKVALRQMKDQKDAVAALPKVKAAPLRDGR